MEAIVEHIVNLPVEDILHMDTDLEQRIAREFLECRICMDRCQNPKDLNCRHFFCEDCLVQLLAKNSDTDIKCPTCRKTTPVPEGGVKDLQSNFYVRSLSDVFKEPTTIESTSEGASDSEQPSTLNSSIQLTTTSVTETTESTQAIASTESNTRCSPTSENSESSDDVTESDEDLLPASATSPLIKTCSKHEDKDLGMVCLTCSKIVCYVCMMESHQQPDHKCKLYQKTLEESNSTLSKFRNQLRVSTARGHRCLEAIEENRNILNDNATQVLEAIQTATTESIRAIYSRSDELIKDVKKIQTEVTSDLTNLSDYSTMRLEDDLKKLDTIEDVLKTRDNIGIISCAIAMQGADPSRKKPAKSVPQGVVNFVRFVKQDLGKESGLGTLQPLDIVILGRDNLFNDGDKDGKRGKTAGDKETNNNLKKDSLAENDVKAEDAHETISVNGVTYHEVHSDGRSFMIAPNSSQSHSMAVPDHQGQGHHYQQHIVHDSLVTNTPQAIGIPSPHHYVPPGSVPTPHQAPLPTNGHIPNNHNPDAIRIPPMHRPSGHPVFQMHNNVLRPMTPPGHRVYHNVQSTLPPFVPVRGPCPFLVPVDPMFVPEIPGPVHVMRPEMASTRRHPCSVLNQPPQPHPGIRSQPYLAPQSQHNMYLGQSIITNGQLPVFHQGEKQNVAAILKGSPLILRHPTPNVASNTTNSRFINILPASPQGMHPTLDGRGCLRNSNNNNCNQDREDFPQIEEGSDKHEIDENDSQQSDEDHCDEKVDKENDSSLKAVSLCRGCSV